MIIQSVITKACRLPGMFLAATLFVAALVAISDTRARADSNDLVSSLPAQIPEIVTGGNWSNGDIGGVYRAVVVLSNKDNDDSNKGNKGKADLLSRSKTVQPATDTKNAGSNKDFERKAEVFIQWISYENGKANAKIVKTVSVKEFNEKQLRHAFLAMDTLKDNEMTLLVTSYDENRDKDVSVSVKATVPGKYETAKTGK